MTGATPPAGYAPNVAFPIPDDEPIFTLGEAARLLRVKNSTLRYWVDGLTRGERTYQPVIRRAATGGDITWPEFIEAGWLREYRQKSVPLQELRLFISHARERFGTEYPLATEQPLRSGRELLLEVQQQSGLSAGFHLVRERDGQLALTEVAAAFVDKVEFDVETTGAARYFPRGMTSPVVIDPLVNFGAPAVRGIRTDVIFEQIRAGEDWAAVAQRWGVDDLTVREAVQWETMLLPAKQAA